MQEKQKVEAWVKTNCKVGKAEIFLLEKLENTVFSRTWFKLYREYFVHHFEKQLEKDISLTENRFFSIVLLLFSQTTEIHVSQ